MIKKIISHPLFSGSALMVGGSLLVNGFNYIYHLAMGRLLGPIDYGVLASIFSLLYLTSVVPISSSFAIVKFVAAAKTSHERNVIYSGINNLVWKVAVVFFIVLVLSAASIAKFLHIENVINVALVGPIVFLSLITLVNQASMQGILKFFGVVGPNFVSSVIKLMVGLFLVILGFSVGGALWGVLISVFLAYLLSEVLRSGHFEKVDNTKFKTGPFLNYTFPVLLQALAFTSVFTFDLILVKHFLPSFEVGIYAALSTLGKIVYFSAQPITAAMFPIVSGREARGESYKKVFLVSFFLTIFISFSVVAFYYFFPDLAIVTLYGKEYLAAKSHLVWMGIFIAIYTIDYILTNFLLSINETRIVVLPVLASLGQIIGIIVWHNNISEVIRVSIFAMLALLICLALYLGYNQYNNLHEK